MCAKIAPSASCVAESGYSVNRREKIAVRRSTSALDVGEDLATGLDGREASPIARSRSVRSIGVPPALAIPAENHRADLCVERTLVAGTIRRERGERFGLDSRELGFEERALLGLRTGLLRELVQRARESASLSLFFLFGRWTLDAGRGGGLFAPRRCPGFGSEPLEFGPLRPVNRRELAASFERP
jgi:hypothetical protein